jgi:hypothetical protein
VQRDADVLDMSAVWDQYGLRRLRRMLDARHVQRHHVRQGLRGLRLDLRVRELRRMHPWDDGHGRMRRDALLRVVRELRHLVMQPVPRVHAVGRDLHRVDHLSELRAMPAGDLRRRLLPGMRRHRYLLGNVLDLDEPDDE